MAEQNFPFYAGSLLYNTQYINALSGKTELIPAENVTRTFTNVDDAVAYTRGSEFSRRFNPTNERFLGIRADFQGTDRGTRLAQSVIDANAEAKLKTLRVSLANATTDATRLEIQQAINQIENRAWYSKRFYTDVNAATAPRDLRYYFAGGLRNQGPFTEASPLTVVAGSEEAAMVPLAQHPPFGGATTSHAQGQEWIKTWKKQYNFPRLILQGGNEARAASYLSTNTASELFPTANTIEVYARPAGVIDPDTQTIQLYGRTGQGVRAVDTLGRSGRIAGGVGAVASLMFEAPSLTAREDRMRREKYPADYTGSRDASFVETGKMLGKGMVGSAVNAITFGMTGVGSNEGRGGRGPARMGDAGDEASRRTMERANSWIPSINDDIKEHMK